MRILVLGGTQFVGRHIVGALVSGGHSVSILTRGRTADWLPAMVERLRGERDGGAGGLAAACAPAQVRPSVSLLRGRVGRYVFVSAVSVYGDPPRGPVDEEHPRVPPAGPKRDRDRRSDVRPSESGLRGRRRGRVWRLVCGAAPPDRCRPVRPPRPILLLGAPRRAGRGDAGARRWPLTTCRSSTPGTSGGLFKPRVSAGSPGASTWRGRG